MREVKQPLPSSGFSVKNVVQLLKNDLLHLIYPSACLICERETVQRESLICSFCQDDFQFTYFETFQEPSSLDKLFWGRVQLQATHALLSFKKESKTQTILHAIKYKSKTKLAVQLGNLQGEKLKLNSEKYGDIDALIPVPLHPKKQHLRGFNQSERIAVGISEATQIPVLENLLTRGKHTESQTKKNRFHRWDNVADIFLVDERAGQNLKHIALVDDVVTTGSTLESCIQKIQEKYPSIRISVLSLAIAT